MADLIRDSINDAGPRPITPYYGDVSSSVQRTWHPRVERASRPRPRGDRRVHVRRARRGRDSSDSETRERP